MIIFNKFLKHLLKEVQKHIFQYLLLLTGAIFFILLFSLFKENHHAQFSILTLFVIFYICWGLIHHFLEKTLHLKIVIEYILIGAIALFLLQTLLIH